MKILFLDLASHQGSIACVTEQSVVSLRDLDHRVDDAELPSVIDAVLAVAKWTLNDLTHLACTLGPGGFTSLRVAVASINALAFGLKIPSTGIHLSDLYEFRVTGDGLREKEVHPKPETRNPKPVWLHSTKKTHLFFRDFSTEKEAELVALADLPPMLDGRKTWTGELIPEHHAVVDPAGLVPAELRPLAEVLPAFLGEQNYESQSLLPWYGRGW